MHYLTSFSSNVFSAALNIAYYSQTFCRSPQKHINYSDKDIGRNQIPFKVATIVFDYFFSLEDFAKEITSSGLFFIAVSKWGTCDARHEIGVKWSAIFPLFKIERVFAEAMGFPNARIIRFRKEIVKVVGIARFRIEYKAQEFSTLSLAPWTGYKLNTDYHWSIGEVAKWRPSLCRYYSKLNFDSAEAAEDLLNFADALPDDSYRSSNLNIIAPIRIVSIWR